MKLNEIKKGLYKENPIAIFWKIRKGVAEYKTFIMNSGEDGPLNIPITFSIPVDDMGDADFMDQMESKFLIRWIVIKEETTS
jgi:hypothetical protein